jgi:hypothetical protein
MRDAGEYIFFRRAGTLDMSCQTCHSETGKRIRASVLPNSRVPQEWTKAISWPAFRVGHDHVAQQPAPHPRAAIGRCVRPDPLPVPTAPSR